MFCGTRNVEEERRSFLRAIYQGNVLTPLALVLRFLPTMLEQSGGTILNML